MEDFSQSKFHKFIAHPDFENGQHQSVKQHLQAVAELSAKLATKLGFAEQGRLIGLMHDFGKYSSAFQNYMQLIVAEQAGYNPKKAGTNEDLNGILL